MARMKTLHIAMTDPDNCIGDTDLDETRMQAWHDSLRGVYTPEMYAGAHKRAYRLGREQIEIVDAEEGFGLFKKEIKDSRFSKVDLMPTLEQELNDPWNEWGTWDEKKSDIDPTLTGTFEWERVEEFHDPDEDYIEGRVK